MSIRNPSRPAARQSHHTSNGGYLTGGSENVQINKYPAIRLGDVQRCPAETNGLPHVSGPVSTASKNVFINGRGAARQLDKVLCFLNPPEDVDPKWFSCRREAKFIEGIDHEKNGNGKDAANFKVGLEPVHFECSVLHIPSREFSVPGLGKGKIPTDLGKVTGIVRVGVEHADGETFAGADANIGGSIVEVEPQWEFDPITIPGTDLQISSGVKVTLAAGTAKAKAVAAYVENPKDGMKLKAAMGAGLLIAGAGVEVFLSLKSKEGEPIRYVEEHITEGSPNTQIGD